MDTFYLASLHMGQECLEIHDQVDIAHTQRVVQVYHLSVEREIFGTGVQHVQQSHLAVGIHSVHMNHVAVSLKLYDFSIFSSISNHAAHGQY